MPILQAFRDYYGISERDDDRTVREKIAGRLLLLDSDFAEFLPVLFEFVGAPDPERSVARMDPDAKQRLIFGTIVIMLEMRRRSITMRTLMPLWPMRQPRTFRDDTDDLFAHFFGAQPNTSPELAPAIESFLKDGEIVVRADLPGIDAQKVDLTIDRNVLTITGERKQVTEDTDAPRGYREVSYGSFQRSIRLPTGVDPDAVKASYTDGVLEVTMKAPTQLVSKKVPVTVH